MDFGAELLDQNRAFGAAVARCDQDAPVPTCPGWTVKQLFRHVGRGNRWAAQMVAERATEAADPAQVPDGRPPADLDGALAWLDDGARLLVDSVDRIIAEDGTDGSVWTFLGQRPAAWWLRRRLHEVLVHRVDAAFAGGLDFEVRPDLAADCIDEWLDLTSALNPGLPGRVHLHAAEADLGDLGEWTIADGTWTHGHSSGDVALRGPVRELMLVTTRRRPPVEAAVEIFGDEELLATWLDGMKF
ncbi:MAG TPA: maleylpyruvate isomerase family mycothiol-dependent enzyme [Mycolicibacterium fallax]|nr:maleylpyruvate isomerase family mycothiol-dependent enzyme [Mycolicibacterium fallax]